jgi:myo-inositol-1(or 4)-monophosphatase
MPEASLAFAIQLAQQAGELLLSYYHSNELQPALKSDRSVVTQADLEADRLIKAVIQREYPNDSLISEEKQPDEVNPGISADRPLWIVDPLDGTTNFSLGLHYWGVLLARLVGGWPELAVAYFPAIDELYVAQSGKGAYLNHKPLWIKPPEANRPRSFFACCSRTFRQYQVSVPYKARILGSAAYTLCSVARSTAVVGFEATAKIWDLAAGWLVVQEAGGVIETLDGSQPFPFVIGSEYTPQNFPVLAAANAEIIARTRKQILPK